MIEMLVDVVAGPGPEQLAVLAAIVDESEWGEWEHVDDDVSPEELEVATQQAREVVQSAREVVRLDHELRPPSVDRINSSAPARDAQVQRRAPRRRASGRRVTVGARAPDDPDPEPPDVAAYHRRKAANQRAYRLRRRPWCPRCGTDVPQLDESTGWCSGCTSDYAKAIKEAAALERVDAQVLDARTIRGRVEMLSCRRQLAWYALHGANGNRRLMAE